MKRSAIIFDLDGTLTHPCIDFDVIRQEIGLDPGPILEAMESMEPAERERATAILTRYEREAAVNATMQEGAADVVAACRAAGHPVAILTRNGRTNTDTVLGRFGITTDAIRTRDDGAVKPSAEPVLALCTELNADPKESWMVGDYLFDILSGKAAGTQTVLMLGDRPMPDFADQADHVIRQLKELLAIIQVRDPSAS